MVAPMSYIPRVVDHELDVLLGGLPAVAIDGIKAVGKTRTARARAASSVLLDSPDVLAAVSADPTSILTRKPPLLIDEWQRVPAVWDVVRRAVDDDRSPGRFLMTGSATPQMGATAHSGAGRITRVRMRPLALSERNSADDAETISLSRLLAGEPVKIVGQSRLALPDYVDEIIASGFPGLRGLSPRLLRTELDSYLRNIVDRDIPEQGIAVRKPAVLLDWLRAYAAATGGTASYNEIRDAATAGFADKPARDTTATYRDALQQLWLLDPVPAWAPIGKEFARLGQAPTHHLADPALAARLLGLERGHLLDGGGKPLGPQAGTILGRLFESLATLSVRVLAQNAEAEVAHLRTQKGDREIDLILTGPHRQTIAIEVKLNANVVDGDVRHLLWFREKFPDVLDTVILNTGSIAYRRPDGVAVIPLALLSP